MTTSPYVELTHRLEYRHALGEMAGFFDALSNSRITGAKCVSCQRTYVPPRASCPVDGSPAEWADVSTSGTVVATSTVARRPNYAAAGAPQLILGLVQLDGVDTAVLAELLDDRLVTAGERVEAVFRDATTHPAQQLAFMASNSPTARGDKP